MRSWEYWSDSQTSYIQLLCLPFLLQSRSVLVYKIKICYGLLLYEHQTLRQHPERMNEKHAMSPTRATLQRLARHFLEIKLDMDGKALSQWSISAPLRAIRYVYDARSLPNDSDYKTAQPLPKLQETLRCTKPGCNLAHPTFSLDVSYRHGRFLLYRASQNKLTIWNARNVFIS